MPREVLKQEVLWVPKERRVPFEGSFHGGNLRVWTLYNHTDPDVRPELPITPIHHHNAFLEDYVHDWNMERGVLRYYSRAVESCVWILVEHLNPRRR